MRLFQRRSRPDVGRPAAGRPAAPAGKASLFRRGVFSVGGGSAVSVAVLFIEAVIVARALPVDAMGAYAFFMATLSLLIIAVDLGFRTTAAQFLAAETDARRRAGLVTSMALVRLLVVGAASALILLIAPWVPGWLGMPALGPLLAYMPLVLALASLDELLTGVLQGFHRYKAIAAAQVARSLLRLGLSAAVLLVLGWGLPALVISWIVSFGASALLQWAAVPARRADRWHADWAEMRRALRFGLPLQATRYLWFGMQRIDTFVLTAFTGPVGVAFYDVAGKLPQGLQRLSEAYFAVYHPSLSARFARHDQAGAARIIRQSLRLFSFLTLWLAWGVVLFGRDAIVLLFKDKYAAAAPAFAVMTLTFSLAASVNLVGYMLTAFGQPGRSFGVNLLRSAVSFGGDFLLIPLVGFIGAAYATLLSQVAAAPLAWWYARRARLPAHGGLLVRQFAVAAAIYAALVWLPPLGAGVRLALLGLFPAVAAALALVDREDLAALLPSRRAEAARPSAQAASSTGGSKG